VRWVRSLRKTSGLLEYRPDCIKKWPKIRANTTIWEWGCIRAFAPPDCVNPGESTRIVIYDRIATLRSHSNRIDVLYFQPPLLVWPSHQYPQFCSKPLSYARVWIEKLTSQTFKNREGATTEVFYIGAPRSHAARRALDFLNLLYYILYHPAGQVISMCTHYFYLRFSDKIQNVQPFLTNATVLM
jgi:hypothetical protein